MAVFLTRGFNLDPGPDPGFSDVAPNAWYYNQTAALAASGITAGCGDGTTFCPNQHTNRAQMATFLARALGLIDQPKTPAYKDVAVGGQPLTGLACGLLADGTLTCWGTGYFISTSTLSQEFELNAPAGSYKAVSADLGLLCAIGTNDAVNCWSDSRIDSRQIEWTDSDTPEGSFKAVDIGGSHSCAIKTDGTITCWGNDPRATDSPDGTYTTIAAGGGHSCAIGTEGTITCWGENWGGHADSPDGTYTAIAAGSEHSCAIKTDGTITCWGNDPRATDSPDGTYTAIAAGYSHSCAIDTDGTITCWGNNWGGQTDAPDGTYTAIAASGGHSCAIDTDGTITCWGSDDIVCCGGSAPRSW